MSPEPRSARPTTAAASAAPPAAVVSLSPSAASAGTAAPSDVAKIAQLRHAVSTGQYKVDLDKLASHMIDDDALRSGSPS